MDLVGCDRDRRSKGVGRMGLRRTYQRTLPGLLFG